MDSIIPVNSSIQRMSESEMESPTENTASSNIPQSELDLITNKLMKIQKSFENQFNAMTKRIYTLEGELASMKILTDMKLKKINTIVDPSATDINFSNKSRLKLELAEYNFPLKTMEEFARFEQHLEENKQFRMIVSEEWNLKYSDLKSAIKAIFSPSLLAPFSLSDGISNRQYFGSLFINDVLKELFPNNYKTQLSQAFHLQRNALNRISKRENNFNPITTGNKDEISNKTKTENKEETTNKTKTGNRDENSIKTKTGNKEETPNITITGNREENSIKTKTGNKGVTLKKTKTGNKVESTETTEQFICKTCKKKCLNKDSLTAHIRNHFYTYECPDCDETCVGDTLYNFHLETVHHVNLRLVTRPKLSCDHCMELFWVKGNLLKHLNERHNIEVEKPYKCDICKGSFFSYSEMRLHMKTEHMSIIFTCKECNEIFSRIDKLQSHQLVHGYKEFKCDKCNKEFVSWHNLRQHQLRIHINARYKCEFCTNSYSKKCNLETHIEQEHLPNDATVSSFRCDLCNDKFYRYSKLLMHLRKNHNISSYEDSNVIDENMVVD